jgi:hypothetical protein
VEQRRVDLLFALVADHWIYHCIRRILKELGRMLCIKNIGESEISSLDLNEYLCKIN